MINRLKLIAQAAKKIQKERQKIVDIEILKIVESESMKVRQQSDTLSELNFN